MSVAATEFDRTMSRPRQLETDPLLIFAVASLLLLGVVMVASASMSVAEREYGSAFFYLHRHAAHLVVGLLLGLVVLGIPSEWWRAGSPVALMFGLALLLVVLSTASWAWAQTPQTIVVDGTNDFPPAALIDMDGGDTEFAEIDFGDIYFTNDMNNLYFGYGHDHGGWGAVQVGIAIEHADNLDALLRRFELSVVWTSWIGGPCTATWFARSGAAVASGATVGDAASPRSHSTPLKSNRVRSSLRTWSQAFLTSL